jgi:hypothetical protein
MVVARVPLLGWHAYCFHIQNMVVSEDLVWVSWGEYMVLKFHIVTIQKVLSQVAFVCKDGSHKSNFHVASM